MTHSINPNLPKARALAAVATVANKCGVRRSTIWRRKRKWDKVNENVELTNYNRPNRTAGTKFRQTALRWNILTIYIQPRKPIEMLQSS